MFDVYVWQKICVFIQKLMYRYGIPLENLSTRIGELTNERLILNLKAHLHEYINIDLNTQKNWRRI